MNALLSACISNDIATLAIYPFAATVGAIYLAFAARILGNARTQAEDSSGFQGSLLLALVGLHPVQRGRWRGQPPSQHDEALFRSTRSKLLGLSFAICAVGLALWFGFNSQTCWFQNMRAV